METRRYRLIPALALVAALAAGCGSDGGDEGGEVAKVEYDELAAWVDGGEPMTLVDVRTAADYAGGHIQNAVSIPLDTLVKDGTLVEGGKALTDKVAAKDGKVVFYCFGYGNDLKAAEAALDLGYTDVWRYEWGTGEWFDQKGNFLVIEYDGFKKWFDAKAPFDAGTDWLVDVLPVGWYTGDDPQHPGGHIPGAVNLPVETFVDSTGTLVDDGKALTDVVKDKAATLVIYCGNYECGKSLSGVKAAVKLGYKKVYRYQGGQKEWVDKGNALTPGAQP
jgi:rhodanese-related sulfurtransferase